MRLADLHLHSTASDGLLAPVEIVAKACAIGLDVIALTDHDSTDGLTEALAAGARYTIRVLTGIEISAELADDEIHILGYMLDYHNKDLQHLLAKMQESRMERAREMIRRLRALGFDLNMQEVISAAGKTSSLGRPHVARVMVEKGYAASLTEVFSRWLGFGQPAYVSRYKLHPSQAIEIIQHAGGLAFLAHPGLLKIEGCISQLAKDGLDGIEVYHPEHSSGQARSFRNTAAVLGLYISGGSDSHGSPYHNRIGQTTINIQDLPWIKD